MKDKTMLFVIGEAENNEQPSNVIYGTYTAENPVQTDEGITCDVTITNVDGKTYEATITSDPETGATTIVLKGDDIVFIGSAVENAKAVEAVGKIVEKLYNGNAVGDAEADASEELDESEEENAEEDVTE